MERERNGDTNKLLDQVDNTPEVIADRVHDTIEIEGENRPKDRTARKVRQLHDRSRQQRGIKGKKSS